MPSPPTIVYLAETAPQSFAGSVFLAGPGPSVLSSAGDAPSWRQQAVLLLAAAGFDGTIFVPEPRDPLAAAPPLPPESQQQWVCEALRLSDGILFFEPGELPSSAPLADEQWGTWKRSGKLVFGAAAATGHKRLSAGRLRIPSAYSLAEAVQLVLPLIRPGAVRTGGERAVPLMLWRSPAFQRWYRVLRETGNRLDDLEVEWTYRPRAQPGRPPLVFAIRPKIWVRGERRHKGTEVVIGRADVSATVLYHPGKDLWQTQVALVREFRSAAANGTGFVWELPGGSAEHAADRDHDPRVTAAREIEQETGLPIQPAQLEALPQSARQVAATILIHRSHLFRAALDGQQLAVLQATERAGQSHGANPSERCYVALRTVAEILAGDQLDWGQVGMILTALSPLYGNPPQRSRNASSGPRRSL